MSLSPPETTPPLEPPPPPPDEAPGDATPPPPPGPSRQSLWRHGDFVKLWTASTISLFGSQVSMIAIPAIAIITLNVSPFEAALLGFFEMLPFILFTLPAGVWVDRLRRRPILIAADVGRAIALVTIPIAFAAGALTIWQLYLVGFVTGIMTVFFDVADQSYLPSLLEADQLIEGNSKLQVSVSAAQIGGQGVGGAIIGLVTAPFAVLADAVSFLVSGVLIYVIRRPEAPPPERPAGPDGSRGPGMRTEIAEGLRYVLGNRYLRNIAASTGTSNLFNSLMFSIFFVYVFRTLELSPLIIGLVGGLANTGFLVGALIAGRLARRIGVGRAIILASFLAGSMELLIPLAPESSAAIPFIIVSMFVVGSMVVIYN
ncbi:MAG: MFS transporter, partial [Chloroflexota bacterium]|nr:MFS transporter [Chloroflexota bacterium]